MSGELEPVGGAVEESAGVVATVVTFAVVTGTLTVAGIRLAWLSETIRATYAYIERCAAAIDRLAEQMAGLGGDVASVAEEHEAGAAATVAVLAHPGLAGEAVVATGLITAAGVGVLRLAAPIPGIQKSAASWLYAIPGACLAALLLGEGAAVGSQWGGTVAVELA